MRVAADLIDHLVVDLSFLPREFREAACSGALSQFAPGLVLLPPPLLPLELRHVPDWLALKHGGASTPPT